MIRHTKACTNPMCFTQGGLYNGYLDPDDEIGDLVEYMTASFGITALNELSILATGKTLKESSYFANTVVDFINEKIEEFKKEDGYLYALYGTPAESLCGTQARQYREYTGDNRFGDYFTNSFHLHVSEDVTPFEKQNKEYELFTSAMGVTFSMYEWITLIMSMQLKPLFREACRWVSTKVSTLMRLIARIVAGIALMLVTPVLIVGLTASLLFLVFVGTWVTVMSMERPE